MCFIVFISHGLYLRSIKIVLFEYVIKECYFQKQPEMFLKFIDKKLLDIQYVYFLCLAIM